MHRQADLTRREHRRHVGRNHRRHTGFRSRRHQSLHFRKFFVVKHRIDGEIPFDACGAATIHHARKIVCSEIPRGMRPHIEPTHTEIDAVRPALNRGRQRFFTPCGSHQFPITATHSFFPGSKMHKPCIIPADSRPSVRYLL